MDETRSEAIRALARECAEEAIRVDGGAETWEGEALLTRDARPLQGDWEALCETLDACDLDREEEEIFEGAYQERIREEIGR